MSDGISLVMFFKNNVIIVNAQLIQIVGSCRNTMGNFVSNNNLYLVLKRAATRYNAENRAQKELVRQTQAPIAAPKHDAGIIDYKKSMQENKSYLEESTKQDAELNERLKNVYVTSSDAIPEPQSANDSKPLPVKRTTEYFELGYKESKFVPSGRVSLMQAMKFINDHRMNASEWTIAKIADDNKIKEDVAADILKYFRTYDLFIPGKTDPKPIGAQQTKLISPGVENARNQK